MQIIIVGCGNVGATLTEQLSSEGHNITVIDLDNQKLQGLINSYDVMGVVGNGVSFAVQKEAGVENAHLLIAVTGSDETNLLCCLIAKKTGGCHTIARVRNPVYNMEIEYIKKELGLSMIINPEFAAATEMSRLLKFPSALTIDSFMKGRVEVVKCRVGEDSVLCDQSLQQIASKLKSDVLICTVERDENVYIPGGNFIIRAKDEISVVGTAQKTMAFFKKLGAAVTRARNVMIIGGGKTAYYLAKQLTAMGIQIKIIEVNKERCEELSELLPKAFIIHGDGTDRNLLLQEGLIQAEAFVAMTSVDEENIMLSLFAKSVSKAKLITHVHRISYDEIIDSLDIGSVVYPKYLTAEHIIKYVRAMNSSLGSNIETLYRLNDNRVEALEFSVRSDSPVIGIPLQDLPIKPNILICSINHRGSISIPGGQSVIEAGDSVIVVTTNTRLNDIRDILK
ncbi:MAG: Trk system potassium transporter TrkA [Roseburia sp.]|nr:Trk system potassium transporter TrkA [Roseburia sp.]MCM1242697.1 Trk system potassium transporter TrkA [Roseburia sp.]